MDQPVPNTTTPAPSPLIRTYAKDFAAVSGKSLASSIPEKPVKQKKPKKEKPVHPAHRKVAKPSVPLQQDATEREPIDLSILERQAETVDAKTEEENVKAFGAPKIEKPIELEALEAGDLVHGNVTPPPPTEFESALANDSSILITGHSSPAPEHVQDERAGILERLRAKALHGVPAPHPVVAESTPKPVPPAPSIPIPDAPREPVPELKVPTPPKPPAPSIPPIPHPTFVLPKPVDVVAPPAPSSLTAIERTLPTAPVAPRIAEKPHAPAASTPASAPLHTYTSDFADHIDQQQATTFAVLAAEKDSHPRPQVSKSHRSFLPVIAGVLLVVVGVVAVGGGYYFLQMRAPVALITAASSIIVSDSTVALPSSSAALQSLAAQSAKPIPQNAVVLVTIASTTSTSASGEDSVLTRLGIQAPDILLRNTNSNSVVGVAHAGSETRPFFVLRVSSYERTFAGMLQWESTLPSDLGVLYPPYPSEPSASTTSVQIAPGTIQFVDEVVANHDVRAEQDSAGKTILIYGYADPTTLIIARDEAAFQVLLTRLRAGS